MASRNFSRRVTPSSVEHRMRMSIFRYGKASYYGTSEAALRECYRAEANRDLNAVKVSYQYQDLMFEVELAQKRMNKQNYGLKQMAAKAGLYAQFLSRLAHIIQFLIEPIFGRTIVAISKVNKKVIEKYGKEVNELMKEVPDNVAEEVMYMYDKALETAYGYFPDKYKDLVPICIKDYIKHLKYPMKKVE